MNKHFALFSYALILTALIASPSFAYAKSRAVCEELKNKEQKAESLFQKHSGQFGQTEGGFENELGNTLLSFEEKRLLQKTQTDTILRTHIEDISRKGTTDAQKKAVATYTEKVKSIIKSRNESIEKAQSEYKTSIKNLFVQKKSLEKIILEQYQDSSKRAFENALRNCERGRPTFLFKRELKNEIEGGHRIFAQKLTSTSYEQNLAELKNIRNQKIQTAQNTFKEQFATLAQTLHTALFQ